MRLNVYILVTARTKSKDLDEYSIIEQRDIHRTYDDIVEVLR